MRSLEVKLYDATKNAFTLLHSRRNIMMLTARQQPTSHALEEPNGAVADLAGAARLGCGTVTNCHAAYECDRESERVSEGRGRTQL